MVLDHFYARDRQRYYQKIQQVRDLDYDFTYWIDYVAEGVAQSLRQVSSHIQTLRHGGDDPLVLRQKQVELLDLLRLYGSLSSPELQAYLQVNRSRVNQLITPLIAARMVQVTGKARASRYSLT